MAFRNVEARLKTLIPTQNIVIFINGLGMKWLDTYISAEVRIILGLHYTSLFFSSVNFS